MIKLIQQHLEKLRIPFNEKAWKASLWAVVIVSMLVPATVYMGLRIPMIEFLNGMAVQKRVKAQAVLPVGDEPLSVYADGAALWLPVVGTVSTNEARAYRYIDNPDGAEQGLINPLPVTMENLRRGEVVFDNYCVPCHGYKGMADGPAVGLGRLAAPTLIHTDKARAYKDGRIFHIITEGQEKMPSYAKQLEPLDRWAAVHYVRVLQRAMNPKPQDMPSTATLTAAPKGEAK